MAQKLAYFNCIGGVSGDMILGSMIDTGLSTEFLNSVIQDLKLDGVSINAFKDERQGVTGTKVQIQMDGRTDERFRIKDFLQKLEKSDLISEIVESSSTILQNIGQAESSIHNVDIDTLVLHELGSIDTLIDVTCCVAGLSELDLDNIYSSPLPSGSGTVTTEHGSMPVPAPVTMAILSKYNVPVIPPPVDSVQTGEMVTPTGAVLLSSLAKFEQPNMTIDSWGYGLGDRNPKTYPNVLGLWIGKTDTKPQSLVLLETNIDDSTPEILAYVIERLLSRGVLDAWTMPINMKKNRTGFLLSVLTSPVLETEAREIIVKETTTLGIRSQRVERYASSRQMLVVDTEIGPVPVKVKYLDGRHLDVSPEYDACRKIALERQLPLKEVIDIARNKAKEQL